MLYFKQFILPLATLVLTLALNACGAEQETEDACSNAKLTDFDQFLGLEYGDEEILLESKLGEFTGGYYTVDSATFIYTYDRVSRVPISVWVNPKTSKINTVFMEVISLGKNFDADLAKAVQEFSINPCDAMWFGLSAEEIKAKLGEPDEEAVSSEGITLLTYDSEDYLITVAFKIYAAQDNRCSSVSINWFYANSDTDLE
ncbi:MAG: hypothetical protein GQ574_23835 [Crocinitomix sp.]|nr:hypothetical protein [Crocinitomix sp.]